MPRPLKARLEMMDPNRDDPLEEQETDRRLEPEGAPAMSDNDQESHVSPPDNDGETVPQDEVVDKVSG